MTIRTLFFGITRDLTGENEILLTVSEDMSLSELRLLLKEKFPMLLNIDSYAIAVNEEYADYDIFLKPNDVVAVIPPVSGG